MIDWTKPIETEAGRPVKLLATIPSYGGSVRAVGIDGWYWIVNDNGTIAHDCDIEQLARPVRNVPAPAPQKCEHRHVDQNSKCIYCGEQRPLPAPDPANAVTFSNTAPQPDSVEAAKKLLANTHPSSQWHDFLTAYISEQTAQRKAAGELAKQATAYADDYTDSLKGSEDGYFVKFLRALAADAEVRSGVK